jgi:predicted nucleic acid-binding protein
MTTTNVRLLVVDASVVRSAGESEHPQSSACRRCLLAIRDICHRVAVTPDIREEWRRHMSRFSRTWRHSMAARRKPLVHVAPAHVPIDMTTYSDAARAAIKKDLCLLEAALAADRVIVTRDDSLREALSGRPDGMVLLQSVRWINPVTDGPEALRTL